MDAKILSLRKQAQEEAQAVSALEKELQKIQQIRTTYIQQQQENNMVLEELGLLDVEANVYKLIGPALIKQDPVEAKTNVETRLGLIKHELGRAEAQFKSIDEKRRQKTNQVLKLQEQIQQQAQRVAAS